MGKITTMKSLAMANQSYCSSTRVVDLVNDSKGPIAVSDLCNLALGRELDLMSMDVVQFMDIVRETVLSGQVRLDEHMKLVSAPAH